ncbi:NERD domain-containing protein [Subtercola sp. PAMC28395]|uniref:nuclease-related domain-containing protein n=1 Tax=Subtercola sp. PAMC28395 TaxID=2846775 RepID=UPI001C0C2162|nr:nuclease-related domain-containing protein [Subtercola sp. PAMC28395]QWT25109.1 NERD domain-containing protein [Subtercola sp. PAMC28395]
MTDPREHLDRFGAKGEQGSVGERIYVDRIRRRFGDRYEVFTSLSIPGFAGDVDLFLLNGDRLVILDIKYWRSAFYCSIPWWPRPIYPRRDLVPLLKDGMWELSRNMVLALNTPRALLPDLVIHAGVVFAPMPRQPERLFVNLLFWPGPVLPIFSVTQL